MRLSLSLPAFLCALWLALNIVQPARADVTFTVNHAGDAVDAARGNGVCATNTGVCTLRAAIQEANALAGRDTIVLRADFYLLTLTGSKEDASATGDLDITDDLNLLGEGESSTVIDGNQIDRLFHLIGVVEVTLSDFTIQNGKTPAGEDGGAIFNSSGGNLSLINLTLRNNNADQWGGGMANDRTSRAFLRNIEIVGNRAGFLGGGLDNHGGAVIVTNSRIVDNRVDGTGGSSVSGGGIYNDGALTIEDSVIDNNQASRDGGGIFNFARLTLERSQLSRNRAGNQGGGIFNAEVRGAQTITHNATLRNVTISLNSAGVGGGLYNLGDIDLLHITLANNQATGSAGGWHQDGFGQIKNSIIANNTPGNCVLLHTIASQGNNLESANSCQLLAATDRSNLDPKLGGLQDNGGTSQTQALFPDSPAIDNAAAVGALLIDQRGFARPQGAGYDIGAYERQMADLVITQRAAPSPVNAGALINYQIEVGNHGPSDAVNLVLTDTLPVGQLLNLIPNGWDCLQNATILRCTRPLLASGISSTIQLALLAPANQAQVTNQAVVDSGVTDLQQANNSTQLQTSVTPIADLILNAIPAPQATVQVGDLLRYTLTVRNAGPSLASNLVISSVLPSAVQLENTAGGGWNCNITNNLLTCSLASLAVGATTQVVVTVRAQSADLALLIPVNVRALTDDLVLSNNSQIVPVGNVALKTAALTVDLSDQPDPALQGERFQYLVSVVNHGPLPAEDVQVSIDLPADVALVADPSGVGWSCSRSDNFALIHLACQRPTLAVGVAPTITILLEPAQAQVAALTAHAWVAATTYDPQLEDNSDFEQTRLSAAADLAVQVGSVMTVSTPTGEELHYLWLVQNHGPSAASGVLLAHPIPAELTWLSYSGNGWRCERLGWKVQCHYPQAAVGALPPLLMTVKRMAEQTGSLLEATVASNTYDGNLLNNQAHTLWQPAQQGPAPVLIDLAVSLRTTPTPVLAGEPITTRIALEKWGLGGAVGVVITYELPIGVLFQAAVAPGFTCSLHELQVLCLYQGLLEASYTEILLIGEAPTAAGDVIGRVMVTAQTLDPQSANNQDSERIKVLANGGNVQADLVLRVTSSGVLAQDQPYTYTIDIANHGPDRAVRPTLLITLPRGVTTDNSQIAGANWLCNYQPTTHTVLCSSEIGLLAGTGGRIAVVVTPHDVNKNLPVTFEAQSSTPDPNHANNRANTVIFVPPPVPLVASVTVSVTTEKREAAVGTRLVYSVAVHNAGPGIANNLVFTQSFPTGTQVIGAVGVAGWQCSYAGAFVTCRLATLPVGEAPLLFITVAVPPVSGGFSSWVGVAGENVAPIAVVGTPPVVVLFGSYLPLVRR